MTLRKAASAALVIATLMLTGAARAADAPTLIVFDLVPEKGVERGAANLLTEIVLNEVNRLGRYTVIGQKDLDKMLTWEQNKQLKGCSDTSCLIQIAGAMGASFYIEGSLGVMGDQFVVTLKLMDAQKVKILERDTLIIEKNEGTLVKALPGLVKKITTINADRPAKAAAPVTGKGTTAPAAAASSGGGDARGAWRVAGWITAGAGVAALGTGVGLWLKAGGIYNELAAGSVAAADKAGRIDAGRRLDRAGIGMMIGGGVTAAVGGALLYYGYAPVVTVGVDRGLTLRVGGEF